VKIAFGYISRHNEGDDDDDEREGDYNLYKLRLDEELKQLNKVMSQLNGYSIIEY